MKKEVFIMLFIFSVLPLKILAQVFDEQNTKKTGLLFSVSYNQLREGLINNAIHKGAGLLIGFDRERKKTDKCGLSLKRV